MTEDKALEKAMMLLRKAESTEFPAEAEALTQQAERIMIRHGVDKARVEAAAKGEPVRREPIVVKRMKFSGTYYNVDKQFATNVCDGLGDIKVLWRNIDRQVTGITMIGFESDVERAEMLIASLRIQAATALKVWWRSPDAERQKSWAYGNEKTKMRFDFLVSFSRAVQYRLEAARREAIQEAQDETPGTDLVLASRATQVEQRVSELYPKLGKSRSASFNGSSAGFEAGRKARLGGNEIGGSRTAIGRQ